jgi:hypothetical protein
MKILKKSLFLCVMLAFAYQFAFAQPWREKKFNGKKRDVGYLAIGGSLGFTNYFGEMNPWAQYVSTEFRTTRYSLGFNVVRKISPRVHVRAGLTWARIAGDDNIAASPTNERHRYRYMRNNSFRNDIFELSFIGTWDLKRSPGVFYKRAANTPYLLLGIAGFYHNPMAKTPEEFGGRWTYLRPLRTEGQGLVRSEDGPGGAKGTSYGKMYSNFQVAIPIGAGIRFKLNDKTDLSFEIGYRLTFTDYLDDVSGNYANPKDLISDLARAMANRTLELKGAGGRSREAELQRITTEVNPIILDSIGNPTITGFGNDGDKRGDFNTKDFYWVTAFHLTRIINVDLRCPKFK